MSLYSRSSRGMVKGCLLINDSKLARLFSGRRLPSRPPQVTVMLTRSRPVGLPTPSQIFEQLAPDLHA